MKLKQVESIVKASKQIHILNAPGCQWFGNGSAFYPLYGMPELDEDTIYIMLDIPEDNLSKFSYTEKYFPVEYSYEDSDTNERVINRDMFPIISHGTVVEPLKTSCGIIFIETRYLKPFDTDSYELYERISRNGQIYIAVKCGFCLRGIIYPCNNIIDGRFIKNLETLTELSKQAFINNSESEQCTIGDLENE